MTAGELLEVLLKLSPAQLALPVLLEVEGAGQIGTNKVDDAEVGEIYRTPALIISGSEDQVLAYLEKEWIAGRSPDSAGQDQ